MNILKKILLSLSFVLVGALLAVGGFLIYDMGKEPSTPPVEQEIVVELNNKIEELELKLEQAEDDNTIKAARVEELEQDIVEIGNQKTELENKNKINLAEIQKLTDEKTALIVERNKLSADNEEAQETISSINARLLEIEEEVKGLESSNADFWQQIETLNADKVSLAEQLFIAQSSLTESQAKVTELTEQITELRSSLVSYIENGEPLDSEKYAVAKFMVNNELYGAQVVLKGTCITIDEPSIKGYKFNGWYLDDTAVDILIYPIDVNTTFVANLLEITLATATWQEIAVISESGDAKDYFAVGDTKTLTLTTGETVTVAIMGFNHDNLSDGTGKAGITFGMTGLLGASYTSFAFKMHSSSEAVSWSNCDMRLTTLPDYYSRLSSELQDAIKSVDKKSCGLNAQIESTSDKLWLFSEVEISGKNDGKVIDEGTCYEYWRTIKDGSRYYNCALKNSSNKDDYWWLRSHDSCGSNTFVHCQSSGYFNYSYNSDAPLCLCFGFCI